MISVKFRFLTKSLKELRIERLVVLFLAAAFGGNFSLFGAPVISTADEAALEHGGLTGFYESSEIKPVLRISGSSAIQVPTTGGTSTISSQSDADLHLTQTESLVGLRLTVRPSKFRYSFFVGQIKDFEIQYASGSATNRFEASDAGFAYGAGVSGSFIPSSIASVGIAWDLQLKESRVNFARFVSAEGSIPATDRLIQDEIQGAITATKRFGEVSPYAGVKLARWITTLEDRPTAEQLSGRKDGASGVLGLEWSPAAGEVGFLEASFLDEESVSAGWGFRF